MVAHVLMGLCLLKQCEYKIINVKGVILDIISPQASLVSRMAGHAIMANSVRSQKELKSVTADHAMPATT